MNYWRTLQILALLTTSTASFSRIVINEIHYDPPIKTELTEFIELHNTGAVAVDLSGWSLSEGVEFAFPGGTTIPAGGYLVVAENPSALQAKYSTNALGPWTGLLANDGETITLRNAFGQVEDKVDYQLGFPWPTVGDLPGYSIELVNPDFDNDLGGSWRRSVRPGPVNPPQTLITEGSTWKYFRGIAEPSNPISAWRTLLYNDAQWETGLAPVGYDGDIVMGSPLTDMQGQYTSFYMRKTFQIADPSQVSSLSIGVMYDDGVQIWINGRRVVNADMPNRDVSYNETSTGGARELREFSFFTIPAPATFLQPGDNVIAVQVHNASLSGSSDAYADVQLVAQFGALDLGATPGAANATYNTNLPPNLRQVEHTPKAPTAGQPVKITVKATDVDGVATVHLLYQTVDPGSYIELNDSAYETTWTTVNMADNGINGDELAGDDIYTVSLPPVLQADRRIVRYRIEATDAGNRTIRAPYLDDPTPNFAYFVYRGVPPWQAAIQPGGSGTNGTLNNFSAAEMDRLPTYHLVAKRTSVETATWTSRYVGDEYKWWGTLVYDGKVYDHIRYRARGGVWRYAMGKNMWKFDFNRGHDFEPLDNYGRPYKEKWRKLNLGANIQQGNYHHRGEQGMFESVGFRLFNMVGVESPKTHWINYRVIDEAQETTQGDQYRGDYWGLYLAIEQEDGRFLDEHDLPDGNLYKMEGGSGELNNQGRYAATDKSDLNAFLNTYRSTTPTEAWWRQNADLEKIYSYHTIVQGIHHYDISDGKNYFYFLNPESGRWSILSWDLDLTWADNMYNANGDGRDDLRDRIVTRQPFSTEYKNRIREIRDLLFNTDQAWKLIDEYALVVRGTNTGPNILTADRSMWDYNPIMVDGNIVDLSKAGHGLYYTFPLESASNPTRKGSFDATVLVMKDYVVKRAARLDNLSTDLIPATPTLTYSGPANFPVNKVVLTASGVSGASAIQWRVGEIRTAAPSVPGIYEIESSWESPEFTTIASEFTLPAEAMRVGRTYRARVKIKDGQGRWSHWSAPVEFMGSEPDNSATLQQNLRLTEVMYNPPAGSDFEFMELRNSSTTATLQLAGVAFNSGIDYVFPSGASLGPGEMAFVVRASSLNNFAAFRSQYLLPLNAKLFGPYSGSLNNDGEKLELKTSAAGAVIFSFSYNDGPGWPKSPDGTGHSLEHLSGSYEYGRNWRASSYIGGSPNATNENSVVSVVINEVNAHTDYSNPARPEYDSNDWIELFNNSGGEQSLMLSEHYLSDDPAALKKWQLPNVSLSPGGYVSFDEVTHFHNPISSGFGLNKAGETVYLSHFPASGRARVVDALNFRGQENGFSVGRYPDGGEFHYTLQPTRDGVNNLVSPSLVITEVMYNTQDDTNGSDVTWQEFVEIRNVTGNAIDLWNTNGLFRLNGGIEFTFTNQTIQPAGSLVVVSFDPNNSTALGRFKEHYGVGNSNITVLGPFSGSLANSSDRITLEKPDAADATGEPLVWVVVDEVIYTDASGADGNSESLNRVQPNRTGNDPTNVISATPTPGFAAPVSNGDRDSDGMPDDWESIYGLNPDLASDAQADGDLDGMTNLSEYIAGTNPTIGSSRFELEVFKDGPDASLSFDAVSGKTYSVQYRDEMANGAWQKLRDISGATGAVTVNDPSPLVLHRFYRLITPATP